MEQTRPDGRPGQLRKILLEAGLAAACIWVNAGCAPRAGGDGGPSTPVSLFVVPISAEQGAILRGDTVYFSAAVESPAQLCRADFLVEREGVPVAQVVGMEQPVTRPGTRHFQGSFRPFEAGTYTVRFRMGEAGTTCAGRDLQQWSVSFAVEEGTSPEMVLQVAGRFWESGVPLILEGEEPRVSLMVLSGFNAIYRATIELYHKDEAVREALEFGGTWAHAWGGATKGRESVHTLGDLPYPVPGEYGAIATLRACAGAICAPGSPGEIVVVREFTYRVPAPLACAKDDFDPALRRSTYRLTGQAGPIRFTVAHVEGTQDLAGHLFALAETALPFLEKILGPYPCEAVFVGPLVDEDKDVQGRGGPGLIALKSLDRRGPENRGTVVHEFVHGFIRGDPWVMEGIARYLELYAVETVDFESPVVGELVAWETARADQYSRVRISLEGRGETPQALLKGKKPHGPAFVVMHDLKEEMGAAAFETLLQNMAEEYRTGERVYVSGARFKGMLEGRVSEASLALLPD